jgi:flagellar hook protein FlgE
MVESISKAGLLGMAKAASEINQVAQRVSSGSSDLTQDIPKILVSSNQYSASAKLISIEDKMNKSILDILS